MKTVELAVEKIRMKRGAAARLEELTACAIGTTNGRMTFDANGRCFRSLLAKYGELRDAVERGGVWKETVRTPPTAAPSPPAPAPTSAHRSGCCQGRAIDS